MDWYVFCGMECGTLCDVERGTESVGCDTARYVVVEVVLCEMSQVVGCADA